MILSRRCWVANCHAEARRESCNLVLCEVVLAEIELSVVDSEPTLCAIGSAKERLNGNGLYAVIRAIGGVLEVQGRCPVITEVVRHLTSGARRSCTNIPVHCGIERITTDDVMNVGGRKCSWLSGGIKALEGQR